MSDMMRYGKKSSTASCPRDARLGKMRQRIVNRLAVALRATPMSVMIGSLALGFSIDVYVRHTVDGHFTKHHDTFTFGIPPDDADHYAEIEERTVRMVLGAYGISE